LERKIRAGFGLAEPFPVAQHDDGPLPGGKLEHQPDQGVADVDQVGSGRPAPGRVGPEAAQARDRGLPAPPAVGGQVVQRPAQVAFRVAVDLAPVPEQPLEGRLEQVFGRLLAAGQQLRRAQQRPAAFGEELLE
jgi:hypothetical protein